MLCCRRSNTHAIVTAAAFGVTPTINMADLHAGVLSLAEDSSESIAYSLMVFLTGRTIVQDAQKTHDAMLTKAKEWDLQAEVASRLIDSLTQLTFDLQVSGSFDATSTISAINLVEQRVEDGCPHVSISDMRGALRECLSASIMFALAHQSSNLTVVLNVSVLFTSLSTGPHRLLGDDRYHVVADFFDTHQQVMKYSDKYPLDAAVTLFRKVFHLRVSIVIVTSALLGAAVDAAAAADAADIATADLAAVLADGPAAGVAAALAATLLFVPSRPLVRCMLMCRIL